MTIQEIKSTLTRKEGVVIEYKTARGGIPNSMWETVSAFANTNGGVIVFGVAEKNKRPVVDGLSEDECLDLKKRFWDLANNRQKLSLCFFSEQEVHEEELTEGWVLVIEVVRVDYKLRPIFLNGNPFGNTFKRNHEGDYHCTDDEVRQMFADANNLTNSADSRILCNYSMEDIDVPTLEGYRREYKSKHENHPWTLVDDLEFLKNIGAYRVDRKTGEEGFTVAGILMFGKTESITDQECLPYFFPDYRQHDTADPKVRWTDRIYPDGRWEANLYNFFNKVLNRLFDPLPKPFQLDAAGVNRIEYTSAHLSVREALANCCIHAAYTQMGNITIDRWRDRFELSNPGTMLVSVEQFYNGKQSVCRNPQLQKMFVLLGIGEKAGSGADVILHGWDDNKWAHPVIEERIRPDRVVLTLGLEGVTGNHKPTTNHPETDINRHQTDINRYERIVLEEVVEESKHIEQLMKVCDYKDRDSFRKSVLNGMLERGLVEMTHPENVKHKDQRYRLTDCGRQFLESDQRN